MRIWIVAVIVASAAWPTAAAAAWQPVQTVQRAAADGPLALDTASDGSAVLAFSTATGVRVAVARPGRPFGRTRVVARRTADDVFESPNVFAAARPGGGGLVGFLKLDGTVPPEETELREDPCCSSLRVARVSAAGRPGRSRLLPGSRVDGERVRGTTLELVRGRAVVGLVRDDGGIAMARQRPDGRFGRSRTVIAGRNVIDSQLVGDHGGGLLSVQARLLDRRRAPRRVRVWVHHIGPRGGATRVYRSQSAKDVQLLGLDAHGPAAVATWIRDGVAAPQVLLRRPGRPAHLLRGPRWRRAPRQIAAAVRPGGRSAFAAEIPTSLIDGDLRLAYPAGPGRWTVGSGSAVDLSFGPLQSAVTLDGRGSARWAWVTADGRVLAQRRSR